LRSRPLAQSSIKRAGLPAGTPIPGFCARSLDGSVFSSEILSGLMFLLIFSDPMCNPCNQLLPRLAALCGLAPAVNVVLVSRGDVDVNRLKFEHLPDHCHVILQSRWEISRSFEIFLTPSAFLVDESGVVESGPAVGAESILNLFRAAAIKMLLIEA
jgi:hypothetical protein